MIRETFPVGQLGCNCTLLGDEISHEAIVVDPGDDIPLILAALGKHGLTAKEIVVTHAHIDHIAGAAELRRITGAPVRYHQNDLMLVAMMDQQAEWLGVKTPEVLQPDADLKDGETLRVSGLQASVLFTPGHTEGSICLYLQEHALLLAGDTLFAGSVGRTDLPGGSIRTLLRSIHSQLLTLPEQTLVIPGHGLFTTIGQERETNPYLDLTLLSQVDRAG